MRKVIDNFNLNKIHVYGFSLSLTQQWTILGILFCCGNTHLWLVISTATLTILWPQFVNHLIVYYLPGLGRVSWKSLKLFRPEKPFVKLQPICSVKLVFSYVVWGTKTKTTTKFCPSRHLCFTGTKENLSPQRHLKPFGTFEKQAPAPCFSKVLRTLQARDASCQTPLVLKSWTFNAFNRIAKFHGFEPRRCEYI